MLRHKQFKNGVGPSGAATYFSEHLSASQYYANGMGVLRGRAFEYLGLSKREIGLSEFKSIENNVHPDTGDRLTPRTNSTRQEWIVNANTGQKELKTVDNHRTGMDVVCNVPKTLSVVMAENPGEFSDTVERICVAANQHAIQRHSQGC